MPDPVVDLQACGRFEWERIVRRIRMPQPLRLVAFTLPQYGDRNGNGIRPGTPRLAAVLEMGQRTVERHLASLRALGLVEKLTNGGGPQQLAAVYRLTIPVDLLERVDMLEPDEVTISRRSGGGSCPVDNAETAATYMAGDQDRSERQLPPSGKQLPPKTGVTPATQVAAHHDHPTTPPTNLTYVSTSPRAHTRSRAMPPQRSPDDPDAERARQLAALDAWKPPPTGTEPRT